MFKYSSINVTDYKWFDQRLMKWRVGFYMNYFLALNLMGIKEYLAKAWDVVGIISGHGKVRIGKSTLAQQVGYYIAWLLAGGKMGLSDPVDPFSRWVVTKKPVKPVRFSMENIVFRPEELMKKADDLYKKYGKNQVIIYDEGRAGLDSAAAMTAVNKMMQEFFQECGQYNHVILIVLPNFFKLHEDYAVNRSLFLIDVYANQKLQRGYFNFYNEYQKELLFNTGKKQIGTIMKYSAVRPSFIGRFTKFSSIDDKEYNKAKRMALIKKKSTRNEMRWKRQRDALLYLIKRATDWPINTIAKEMTVITGEPVTERTVSMGIANVTHQKVEEVK